MRKYPECEHCKCFVVAGKCVLENQLRAVYPVEDEPIWQLLEDTPPKSYLIATEQDWTEDRDERYLWLSRPIELILKGN